MYVLVFHGLLGVIFYLVVRKKHAFPIRLSILIFILTLFPKAILENKLQEQVKMEDTSSIERGYRLMQIEKNSYFYYFKDNKSPGREEIAMFLKGEYKYFSDVAKKCVKAKAEEGYFMNDLCSSIQSLSYKFKDFESSIKIGEVLCDDHAIRRMRGEERVFCKTLLLGYLSRKNFLKAEELSLRICRLHGKRVSCRLYLTENEGLTEDFQTYEVEKCRELGKYCLNYIFTRIASSLDLHSSNYLIELGKEICSLQVGLGSCNSLALHLKMNELIRIKDISEAKRTFTYLKGGLLRFRWSDIYLKRVAHSIEVLTGGGNVKKNYCYLDEYAPAKLNYLCRNEPYVERSR